jgi:hypothetical protein
LDYFIGLVTHGSDVINCQIYMNVVDRFHLLLILNSLSRIHRSE